MPGNAQENTCIETPTHTWNEEMNMQVSSLLGTDVLRSSDGAEHRRFISQDFLLLFTSPVGTRSCGAETILYAVEIMVMWAFR